MESGTTVTIFYGEDVTAEQAEEVRQLFAKALPMADVTMLPGGRPVYKYILMCE